MAIVKSKVRFGSVRVNLPPLPRNLPTQVGRTLRGNTRTHKTPHFESLKLSLTNSHLLNFPSLFLQNLSFSSSLKASLSLAYLRNTILFLHFFRVLFRLSAIFLISTIGKILHSFKRYFYSLNLGDDCLLSA